MSVALTVVVPRRLAIPASDAVFRKRRIAVVVVLAIVLALGIGVGQALASRGGVPASTSTARPATGYVVQPGDTLWSIARTHRASRSQADYVADLVESNGGASLQIGQLLALP